ncbi:Protein bem46 [Smittium mucronatum]|uniref:Protein bem46 n=1 Tax=Smittium mucronatum TaxID=133383 RepID=A0A1R0GNW6_9FUNG|nr:Protein bem46 [Smittium mucronatum]
MLETLLIVLKYLTGLAIFLAIFGVATLYVFQSDLIYKPNIVFNSRTKLHLPSEKGLPNSEYVKIKTNDNVLIEGFLIKHESDEKTKQSDTLLFFPPNSGNIGHKLPEAKSLFDKLGCNIFMLSYRGFGLSEGIPSEKGIRIDAECALSYLRSNPLTSNSRIIVYGFGFGGSVAIDLVSKYQNEFSGLILTNTSTSTADLIASELPFTKPIGFIFSDTWDSVSRIKKIKSVPILFLCSENDDYVPTSQMKTLFDISSAYSESDVGYKSFPGATHTNITSLDDYYSAISDFWKLNFDTMPKYEPTYQFSTMLPKQTTLYKK